MGFRTSRVATSVAALALVVSACSGTTPSASTGSSAGASAGSSAGASAAASPSGAAVATPVTSGGSTAQPGQVEIRWYCCLGGGDAPEQVAVEQAVAEKFNASHPDIHLTFEAVPYAGANDALSVQISSGNGPDIVGPVGIGGANAFHGQWLDLAPLHPEDELRPLGLPRGRGQHLQAR